MPDEPKLAVSRPAEEGGGPEDRLAEAEHRAFEAEARYDALLNQLPVAIYSYSPKLDGPTFTMSPFIEELLGVPAQAFIDNEEIWDELIHPDDRERSRLDYESYLRTGQPAGGEYRYVRPDGSVVWVYDRSAMICDEEGKPLYIQGVMYDITPPKESQLRMQHMAYHDQLTGLPNRAMLEEHLGLALARAAREDLAVAVGFLDLDAFKPVNDVHGHATGDEVLRQMAARLRSAMRDVDLVARQGGDEFILLLADLHPGVEGAGARATVEAVGERIGRVMAEPFGLRVGELSLRASTGWAIYPGDASDARGLLKRADEEMYRRKREQPSGQPDSSNVRRFA